MPDSRPPPMALTFSFTNIMKFLSYMAPFLISFFMIMFSVLTGSIVKGLLFISGLLLITFINYLLKNSLKSSQDEFASPMCNTLPAPFTLRSGEHVFNSPSTSSTIIAFTLAYLAYPMILKPENFNPVLIVFLVGLIGINGAVEVQDRCTNISGIFLGSLVGILFGIIFFSLIKISGNESLAFFTEQSSNGIQCSKPGKTQFKCVKKHGSSLRDISEERNNKFKSNENFSNEGTFVYPMGCDLKKNRTDGIGGCRVACHDGPPSRGKEKIDYDVREVSNEEECKQLVKQSYSKYKAYEWDGNKKCELWMIVPETDSIYLDTMHNPNGVCRIYSRDGKPVKPTYSDIRKGGGIKSIPSEYKPSGLDYHHELQDQGLIKHGVDKRKYNPDGSVK